MAATEGVPMLGTERLTEQMRFDRLDRLVRLERLEQMRLHGGLERLEMLQESKRERMNVGHSVTSSRRPPWPLKTEHGDTMQA